MGAGSSAQKWRPRHVADELLGKILDFKKANFEDGPTVDEFKEAGPANFSAVCSAYDGISCWKPLENVGKR